eukprot:CAMPEP_0197503874 /NCGR_PEP_ID=MMETSP1312-20131121/3031_1 /TAXON_ID=464262 /ORGANISM="Genus nov. species nov., Strain RCC2335" /LENGTH=187 /DNA_ID=CAMNT_0043050633 /DNA_START=129 /DNA_END=692 /DNA_ORIENTATION=+
MHSFPRNPPTHPPPTQVLGHGDPPPPPLPCTTTSVAAAVAEDSLVDLGQRDVVQHGHLPLLRGEVGPESRVLVANLEHRVKRGRGGQVVRLVGEEGRDSEGAQPHREGEGPVLRWVVVDPERVQDPLRRVGPKEVDSRENGRGDGPHEPVNLAHVHGLRPRVRPGGALILSVPPISLLPPPPPDQGP